MKFKTKLLSGYAVVLLFMIAIAIIVTVNVTKLINNQEWVDHTWDCAGICVQYVWSNEDIP